MNKAILFEESAVRLVLQEIKKTGYTWNMIDFINKGRYCMVHGTPNIAIMLKTEPFMNFGYQFKKQGESGVGDSINVQHLKQFIINNVEIIYTMFRDGKIYKIDINKILCNSHKWTQKEGTEVRSFSIHLYERVN